MHVVILLLHLAEIAMSHQGYSPSIISYSILADAAYIGQLALTVGIAYYVLYLLSDFIARMLLAMLFIVLITMQMGLMQYFLTSSTLLGADFWTYSMEDITFTIKASAEIKWWQLLIIPVFIGIAMRMHYAMQQYTLPIIPSVVIYTGYIILFIIAQSNFIPQKKDIASRNLSTNKSAYFIEKSIQLWRDETDQIADELIAGDHEFPFQRIHDTTDLLGNYLHKTPIPPNVVMVVVEGLGKTFVGNNAEYGGAMPFLDSLTNQGLFWSNFLSTTGRTFGIIPSLTASLPYGKSGFMELEEYPYHTSIIKILKQNGYYTSFFYGGDAKFDGQKKFLQQQEIDQIIDEYEFDDQYIKIPPTKDGFSWGYQDAEVYKRSFEQKRPKQPYLDLFLTVTSHEPFLFSGIEKYQQRFNNFLAKATNKTEIKANENAFKTLMYADDALR
ncbi:MAG: LTA synthase family protein, partial [Bacteroidota bacterium]